MHYFENNFIQTPAKNLPIFKHSQKAISPCYLVLSGFNRLEDRSLKNIEEKIEQKIIVGIISLKENLKYFQKYKEKYDIELIECADPSLFWAYLCYKNYPLLPNYRIAVTGTNGKTSTTWFIYQLLLLLQQKVLLINSLGIFANGQKIADTINTTPDSAIIHEYAHNFTKENGQEAFLICEISSIAIEQNRVAFIKPTISVWTNFSHEHLDYHYTMENYKNAKMALGKLSQKYFIHNSIEQDDDIEKNIEQNTKQDKYEKYGHELINAKQDKNLEMKFMFDNKIYETWADIFGVFQANNILSSAICLKEFFDIPKIIEQIPHLSAPIGRMQKITQNNKLILIDNAHKPEALENVLKSVMQFKKSKAKLIIIAGCGGNRDMQKRPIMGKIMQKFSDIAIITSDNPRNEDPKIIASQMLDGCDNQKLPITIIDRKTAIAYAINLMQENDILIIAGKGNEIYQEFENGRKVAFEDYAIAKHYLSMLHN